MVQIISSLVILFCTALALAAPIKVESDISQISTQVNALMSDINALSDTNPNLLQALAIHTSVGKLGQALTSATSDTTSNGALDDADGSTIVGEVSAVTPVIQAALNGLVAKKDAFTTLDGQFGGIISLVQQDLHDLNSDTTGFASALIADAPASVADEATSLKNAVVEAFATAILAYSE